MIVDNGKYYLYRHLKIDDGIVFYIGMGTKKLQPKNFREEYTRALAKTNKGPLWKNMSNKHGYTVEIMLESDNYDFIKEKEVEFIKLYGRRDLNTGILSNLTDGGEGVIGAIRTQEWKDKIAKSNTGKPSPNKGKTTPLDIIEKIRFSNLGKKRSDLTKQRVREGRVNQDMSFCYKPVLQYTKENILIKEFPSIKDAALATNQKSHGNISLVCKNKRNFAGEFIWKFK